MKRSKVLLIENDEDGSAFSSEFSTFWDTLLQDIFELYRAKSIKKSEHDNAYLHINSQKYIMRPQGGQWLPEAPIWADEFDVLIIKDPLSLPGASRAFLHQKRLSQSEAQKYFYEKSTTPS